MAFMLRLRGLIEDEDEWRYCSASGRLGQPGEVTLWVFWMPVLSDLKV